jgi:hypothetical protein
MRIEVGSAYTLSFFVLILPMLGLLQLAARAFERRITPA